MPELYQTLYYSRALLPDTAEAHAEILAVSQRNNRRDSITGFCIGKTTTLFSSLKDLKPSFSKRCSALAATHGILTS